MATSEWNARMAHSLHVSRTVLLSSVPLRLPVDMLCFAAFPQSFPSELYRPLLLYYQSPGYIRLQRPLAINWPDISCPSSRTFDNPAVGIQYQFTPANSAPFSTYRATQDLWLSFPQIFYVFRPVISNFLPYLLSLCFLFIRYL